LSIDKIGAVSGFLNDHRLVIVAPTLDMSAEKDEPALGQAVEETAAAIETKAATVGGARHNLPSRRLKSRKPHSQGGRRSRLFQGFTLEPN